MATIRIAVDPALLSAAETKTALEARLAQDGTPTTFTIEEPSIVLRALPVPPAVLVAVVKGVSAVLKSIIGGLSDAAKQKADQKIIIQGKSGRRIEFPANLPRERVDELIEQAALLDSDEIKVGLA